MRVGEDSVNSSDTGSPVTQQSITGLGAVDIQTSPLAIGAGMGIGDAHFSSGSDISFVSGDGSKGKLIAHELTHVVQQN